MIELNKIHNEDCLETMAKMPDNFVDYTITSPPYNVGKNGMQENKYSDYKDDLTKDDYLQWNINIINELLRITKNHIFYNIQMLGDNKISFLGLLGYYKEKIKDIIIWKKKAIPHIEPGVLSSSFEFIIIFSNKNPEKKKFYDGNFSNKNVFSNLFEIKNSHSNKYAKEHRAVYPLDLPRTFMQKFGIEGDIWYDCFMGSGTTAVASILEKRQFIGSEINNIYVELSDKRIKPYLSQKTLF
tara:strand:- start:1206 stop:1928 length:723 start_codon:yes stop_codon:yes gene_type:complete